MGSLDYFTTKQATGAIPAPIKLKLKCQVTLHLGHNPLCYGQSPPGRQPGLRSAYFNLHLKEC